ncbi:kinetochore fta4 [Trichoderma arundinaceum]|uniref:Kinetochore fta4 n=1 Tax=Trichoderma arundinaceum TaxID=490622 RepID=A0A395NUJ0_TRIAR|nr:kinetochore fta4 [Trichoderma arundinaceum]
MPPAPTITSAKQTFVAAQTNLLSQPIAPSRAWRASNDASEHALPNRPVEDAVASLNRTIQQHCRRVYAPQASRHVAEQINNVYSRDTERRMENPDDAEGGIGRELDLVDESAIETLPAAWPLDKDADAYPMEATRYAETVRQLTDLNQQRKDLRQRVGRLRSLEKAVESFRTTDGVGVQENLVTRDGPVEKELEKMRFLLARVAGRVSELSNVRTTQEAGGVELNALTEARKKHIEEFLADGRVFPS